MKRIVTFVKALILAFLLMNCSDEGGSEPECIHYFSDISGRPDSRTLKGEVMFSWKEGGRWHYSIVPNLNIRPAHEAVSSEYAITGEECLKENLLLLPLGEEVFWEGDGRLTTTEGKNIKLEFPPSHTLEEIMLYCEDIDISLTLFE
ncbi:MAG: hypothetical protein PVF73_05885 [Bacteroidales bacterium]|jgi:hypothetical protein